MEEHEFEDIVADLLRNFALVPTRTALPIAPVAATSTSDGMTMTNFREQYANSCLTVVGPRKGEKQINPVDAWRRHPGRLSVAGLQLRPDMSEKVFKENGRLYINVFDPVVHADRSGDPTIGIEFLKNLLPDAAEWRYFTQWLAYKFRNPAVPGPAIVMLARNYGTGRGRLFEMKRRVFGERYVKSVSFDILAQRNYQGQYTAWRADSLLTVVNESSTSEGSTLYRAKHDTYERLKEVVDPSTSITHFVVKGLPSFDAPSFTSYIIATNNPDALPLPEGDRRFWVGTNGSTQTQEYWNRFHAWLDVPANIGAFAHWLEQVDLTGYSPFTPPPMTVGKAAMTELSKSSLDRTFEAAMRALPGRIVTPEHIYAAMQIARADDEQFPHEWQKVAMLIIRRTLFRVGDRDGANYHLRSGSKKHSLYARTQAEAAYWTGAPASDLRAQVEANGPLGSGGVERALRGLRGTLDSSDRVAAPRRGPH